jgi:protein-tyrosine phosphatase
MHSDPFSGAAIIKAASLARRGSSSPMIDLHSHILAGLDDGAPDLQASLAMARIAASDGITRMACTPHVVPGLYDNSSGNISSALTELRQRLRDAGIELDLLIGADIHMAPDLEEKLASGTVPTLNRTRYFLLEPPHHILPPRIEEMAARLTKAGFVPIITHPERLTWIKSHYDVIKNLNRLGCLLQLTADSITGGFGKGAQYLAHRLLDEGRVAVVATDCHGAARRRPVLSRARRAVADRLGEDEAEAMVLDRPRAILANRPVRAAGPARSAETPLGGPDKRTGLIRKLFGGIGI